jgi:NADH-quinone oxidoreductase subunit C
VNAEDTAVLAGAAFAMCEPDVSHAQLTVTVERGAWLAALGWARDELGCSFLGFLRGADEPDADPAAIMVVAHLHTPSGRHHLLLRTLVPAADPRLPTATGLFGGAHRHEREVHEMVGLSFTGHPHLDALPLRV